MAGIQICLPVLWGCTPLSNEHPNWRSRDRWKDDDILDWCVAQCIMSSNIHGCTSCYIWEKDGGVFTSTTFNSVNIPRNQELLHLLILNYELIGWCGCWHAATPASKVLERNRCKIYCQSPRKAMRLKCRGCVAVMWGCLIWIQDHCSLWQGIWWLIIIPVWLWLPSAREGDCLFPCGQEANAPDIENDNAIRLIE